MRNQLTQTAAVGVNNTDINTRTGWYSRSVTAASRLSSASDQVDAGGWSGSPLTFPRIQGADACGSVVAVGEGVPRTRIGERVIVATMQQAPDGKPFETVTLGSEMDGAVDVRYFTSWRADFRYV